MIPKETKNFPILTDLFDLADHDVICKVTFCQKKKVHNALSTGAYYMRGPVSMANSDQMC